MADTLTRASAIEDYTGRTLEGRAYRYDSPSRVTDNGWQSSYYEEMVQGNDAKTLRERSSFPLFMIHDATTSVGTVTFSPSADERALMFRAVVDLGPEGDAVLAEIDQFKDVSVGFDALKSTQRTTKYHGSIVQRREIRLNELSLAPNGTGLVKGAEIQVVRAALELGTPRLDALRRRSYFL